MTSKKKSAVKDAKNNSKGRIVKSQKQSKKKPEAKKVIIPIVALLGAVILGLLLGVLISRIRANIALDKIGSENSYNDENPEDSGGYTILDNARLREIQELAKRKAEEKANELRQEEIAELERKKAAITKQYKCGLIRDTANTELDTAYTSYRTKLLSCMSSMNCKADKEEAEYQNKIKQIKNKYNNQLKSLGCSERLY